MCWRKTLKKKNPQDSIKKKLVCIPRDKWKTFDATKWGRRRKRQAKQKYSASSSAPSSTKPGVKTRWRDRRTVQLPKPGDHILPTAKGIVSIVPVPKKLTVKNLHQHAKAFGPDVAAKANRTENWVLADTEQVDNRPLVFRRSNTIGYPDFVEKNPNLYNTFVTLGTVSPESMVGARVKPPPKKGVFKKLADDPEIMYNSLTMQPDSKTKPKQGRKQRKK